MIGERATFANAPVAAAVFHAVEGSLTELGFNLIVCQAGKNRRLPPKIEAGGVDGPASARIRAGSDTPQDPLSASERLDAHAALQARLLG